MSLHERTVLKRLRACIVAPLRSIRAMHLHMPFLLGRYGLSRHTNGLNHPKMNFLITSALQKTLFSLDRQTLSRFVLPLKSSLFPAVTWRMVLR